MFKPVVLESLPSSSPLASRYDTAEFKLALENDISAHVAENALHLRRFREYSQMTVAAGMGTSQSKIARIEGGDENITLRTLKNLATALGGRIRFALEPAEFHFPALAPWWQTLTAVGSSLTWKAVGAIVITEGGGQPLHAAAIWTADQVARQIAARNLIGSPSSPIALETPSIG